MVLFLSKLFPFVCAVTLLGLFSWHPITLDSTRMDAEPLIPERPSTSTSPTSLRDRIEQATRDEREQAPFPKVVVLNLATRRDRRDHMRALARAHDLDISFVDATPYTSPEIIWIHERLYDDSQNITWTHGKNATETWWSHYLDTPVARLQPRPSAELPSHVAAFTDFPQPVGGVSSLAGPLACFVTHLSLLRRIVDENWGPAIVFEDDIDLEWNFKQRWTEVVDRSMPKDFDWHLLYLGYSFSKELENDPVHSPFLRPSYLPMATFAYAVSPSGARGMLDHMSLYSPLFAKPIDHVYVHYLTNNFFDHRDEPEKSQVLSFVPPLVGHGGSVSMGSDIGGTSNMWGTELGDSTLARLAAYEGSKLKGGRVASRQV